jgi:O-6-methylguanine DNA methyltransferase
MSNLSEKIYKVVAKIPKGKVLSYGEVARRAGAPGAARVAGTLMRKNPYKNVPCHRVILADGRVGNYSGLGGKKGKIRKLIKEGVIIKGEKIIRDA